MVTTFTLGHIPLPVDTAALANKICDDANITPNQLYIKWETWALTHDKSSSAPSAEDLRHLAAHIRQSAQSTPNKSRATRPNGLFYPARPTPTRVNVDDFFSYLDDEPQPDPQPKSPPGDPSSPQPDPTQPHDAQPDSAAQEGSPASNDDNIVMSDPDASPPTDSAPADDTYTNRTGSGRIEATLNSQLNLPTSRASVKLSCPAPTESSDSCYMNDDIPSRILAVRAHLTSLTDKILNRIKHIRGDDQTPEVTPEAFHVKSPNIVMTAGRIRVELEEGDGVIAGRINPSSVVLESPDGNLVKLNLKRMNDNKLPLFLNPGMIVVVEGINTTGCDFEVHAIYDNTMEVHHDKSSKVKEQAAENDDDEIMADAKATDTRPYVNIVAASGPFTTSANLKYEPLEDLVQVIARNSPDIVLLTGPFVDAQHEEVSETTPVPFDKVFESRILNRLKQMLSDMTTADKSPPQVVIVPSLDDVHHEFVCPQPPFRWAVGQTEHPNIHFWANPCVLKMSVQNNSYHASLGLTSLPALQDISADSLCWNKPDRLGTIVSHMLRQRSFYPSFPPSSSVPLDSSFLERLAVPDMDTSPTVDVIVVPSRLKAFAKCVDGGTVAVNPGLLCRGSNGGTYAEICLPLHLSDRPRPSNLNEEQTQVNVVRL